MGSWCEEFENAKVSSISSLQASPNFSFGKVSWLVELT